MVWEYFPLDIRVGIYPLALHNRRDQIVDIVYLEVREPQSIEID